MTRSILFTTLIFLSTAVRAQNFADFAPTPPMGWNSWDCYGPTVTEDEVKANADFMAAHLKNHGWQYIVVDIRWYVENDKSHGYNEKDPLLTMDNYGRFIPAPNRFPSSANGTGFKALADYVHSKGLKFGIHIMRGIPKLAVKRNTPILGTNRTANEIYSMDTLCLWLGDMYTVDMRKPGAQEYYNSLLALYASWGVDFLKVDDLSRPYHRSEVEAIRRAIDGCGRPIVLSTSPGETPIEDGAHVASHANMWRIIDDFWDNWPEVEAHFPLFEKWIRYMGPGHWPDGDMLPLGRIGIRAERGDNRMSLLTHDEQTTLMSLFCICRSPLIFGGDLPQNDEFTTSLMTNDEVLGVLNKSAHNRLLFHQGEKIAWTADDTSTGDKYVALFYASGQKPILENRALWNSTLLSAAEGEKSTRVKLPIGGAAKLYLVVTEGGDGNAWDHADWIEPTLTGINGSLDLTTLKWVSATSGWETPKTGRSVGGNELIVDDTVYTRGIGTHASSTIEYDIPPGYDTFSAIAGLDKECLGHPEGASVRFHIFTQYPTGAPPSDSIEISFDAKLVGLEGRYNARDLWSGRDLGSFVQPIVLYIPKHGARLLKLTATPE